FQTEAIRRYAVKNGFAVVATYSDPGKSGVEIKHRPGLRQLIQDVVGGHAPYSVIIVYDVSRWGRFQDVDESAHYEFVCRSAGVPVHYCAEQFENDGRMSNNILKAFKRTMAAEFSRELAVKVYAGQRQVVANGFWGGSTAGYGLRRMMISSDGRRKGILQLHEHKNIRSDHVILVPGPKHEVECIRLIFALAADERQSPSQIAKELNRQKIKYVGGKPWNKYTVWNTLKNEKYIGCNVWGRTTKPFGKYTKRRPRNEWTKTPGAFIPLIDAKTFDIVQKLMHMRNHKIRKPDSYYLGEMRKVLKRKGELSQRLLKKHGVFDHRAFVRRFGSMKRAYELMGYTPPALAFKAMEGYKKGQSLRAQLLSNLSQLFPSQLRIIRLPHQSCRKALELDNHVQIAVHMCRPLKPTLGGPRWILIRNRREERMVSLICMTNKSLNGFAGMYLVPELGSVMNRFRVLRECHPLLTAGKRLDSLYEFYDAAKEVSERWKPQDDFIVVGDAMLKERASLLIVSDRKLKLSRIEATIFKLLLENAGRPVSPVKMSSCPGGPNEWFARAHISALRKKLGRKLRKRLVTVIGEGYMYKSVA
ncbi:MAG TPA: recombinase family protein, partial [Candidatus Acidoferrum sp.]|nr:recombinase family protein [Candidatus Acidoferrum sp.]